MGLIDLIGLFTRIPVPAKTSVEGAARSFDMIPVLGLIEGVVIGLVFMIGCALNCLLGSALALAAHLLVTGGIHLDGLADYADAALPGYTGEQAYRVMKDPRIGSLGVSAIVVTLLTRFAAAASLTPWEIMLAYVVAAESLYIASLISKPLGEGLGQLFISEARRKGVEMSIGWTAVSLLVVLLAAYLGGCADCFVKAALAAIPAGITPSILIVLDANNRLGGVNGDVLGACFETSLALVMVVEVFA